MKKIFFILQLLTSINCLAQDNSKAAIALIARGYADHIVLRYFPTTPVLFDKANEAGYVLERAVFKTGVPVEKLVYTPVKGSPFKRWDEAKWETVLQGADVKDTTTTKLAGFAMMLSDSSAKPVKGDVLEGGLKSLMEERNNQDMKLPLH
jgi:hypothetical protein